MKYNSRFSMVEEPPWRHCMFHKPLMSPGSPASSSVTVNWAKSTRPSSPAMASGLVPGAAMYQLPPAGEFNTNPLPAWNSANASDIPMELTGSSLVLSEPMVNQLSYSRVGSMEKKVGLMPLPKLEPTGFW